MVPSDTPVEQIYGISQNFKRISEREKLKQQERYLAGVTKKYNAQFSTIQAILQNTLFGNTDMHKIKLFHHIPDKSPTADYMGAKSLRAKNNAIYNAIANIDTNKTTYNTFISLIQKSAMEQRQRMQYKYGITPEHDIYFQPISKTQGIFNQMRKKFIKQYAFETLR
ncbi:MAG: hypothetical protein KBS86_03505 [Proteobacteria bacterium]|nr:hypothetical protein [Candidatus Enterousia scatequi]